MTVEIPQTVLVDARNWEALKPHLIAEIQSGVPYFGFDCETNDARRHEGLNRFMAVNAEGKKASNKKLVFDTNRTDITGFSWYCDESKYAYYLNLMHADVENRIPWSEAKQIVDAVEKNTTPIAHNAPYELTMFRKSLGHNLWDNLVCSMQLAVSLFNADTYAMEDFLKPGLGEISRLFPAVIREFMFYDPAVTKEMTKEQAEIFYKVVAKESDAGHSYNGYIGEITYGYGLKALTKRFLGYEQKTFAEVIGDKAHMGQLTGEEVASYGADDAWVCVKLFKFLLNKMINENPQVLPTFLSQENPMIHVYSEVWGTGVRIDLKKVLYHQAIERKRFADVLRKMKEATKKLLPFPVDPHEKLAKYDTKYNSAKYRANIVNWTSWPNREDDFQQLFQVKCALTKQWAQERCVSEKKITGMSITYYQQVRAFLYDLCGCSFRLYEGKVQSDGETQVIMMERWIKKYETAGVIALNPETKEYEKTETAIDSEWERFDAVRTILKCYRELANSEQTIKLFINMYLNLTDPQTGRVYLSLNSLLNSRRMALSTPNLSQLPKFGDGAYVRSFFLPDEPWVYDLGMKLWVPATPSFEPSPPCDPGYEQVLLSADWSGIELVLIGDASKDKTFAEAYSSLPHGDLHTGTAADLLGYTIPEFKALPNAKQVRNEVGKPANFGYWYSGALGTTAKEQGWTSEFMWKAVERYRNRYPEGEAWRLMTQQHAREWGFVRLPDGHTRIRFESTYTWAGIMRHKFESYGHPTIAKFGELVIKKIQNRSHNQAVNSMIQGTCATLAKRTAIAVRKDIKAREYQAQFKFPVHDEFVYSVAVFQLWSFMQNLWERMCNHPEIVTSLKLDASMAIGLNYQAYNEKTNPKGQIELSELTKLPFIPEARWGKKATEAEVMLICDYLFDRLEVQKCTA